MEWRGADVTETELLEENNISLPLSIHAHIHKQANRTTKLKRNLQSLRGIKFCHVAIQCLL